MAKWIETVSERCDLPAEAAGLPKITLTGDCRVLIENHKGLLEYSGELVEVSGGRIRIRVRGSDLYLRAMDSYAIVIGGRVFGVDTE